MAKKNNQKEKIKNNNKKEQAKQKQDKKLTSEENEQKRQEKEEEKTEDKDNIENTEKSEQEEELNKEEKNEEEFEETKFDELLDKYNELNDKYLRLSAEYDNYRKRTLKEKMELIKNGGEDVLKNILPVIDNFERALNSLDEASDLDAVKEGINLIYNNFKEFLKQRGIKEIEAIDKELDTDLHEAVAQYPAKDKKKKGKIIDVIEKGYKLNEKVLRFAKVVVAQ